MVVALALISFVAGVATGVAVYAVLYPRDRKRPALDSKPGFSLFGLKRPAPATEQRKIPTEALPRSLGSWRQQKAELERDHNSKQKERDRRIAGL